MKVERELSHLLGEGSLSHLIVIMSITDEGFQRTTQMMLIESL